MARGAYDFTVSIGGRIASSLGAAVSTAQRSLGGLAQDLRHRQEANSRGMAQSRGRLFDAAALGASLYGVLQPAVEFEAAMGEVRKLVDFDTPQQFGQMGQDILQLSRRLPIAAEGIASIVAAGGAANIPRRELLGFAESAAQMATAFGISAEESGAAMANLRTSLKLDQREVVLLADAINLLGDKSAAREPDILEFTRRLGGLARTSHLGGAQLAAFGSAMMAAGAEPERAATSMQHILLTMSAGASATKKQKEAFAALGLSATAMSRRMMRDAPGAIMAVMEQLNRLPEHRRLSVMRDLFGEEGLQALAPMLSNLPELRRLLGLVADESSYAGNMARQFGESSMLARNQLQLFKNRATELSITLGTVMLPGLVSVVGALGPLATQIAELAKRHPQVTAAIGAAAFGLVGLRVATIGAGYAWRLLLGGALTASRGVVGATQVMGRGLSLAFVPLRAGAGLALVALRQVGSGLMLLRSGGIGVGAALSGALAGIGRGALALLNPMSLVRSAMMALRVAFIGTGVGALVVGLAMAGAWIYNNWSNVKEAFEGFGSAFMAALGPARPVVEGVGSAISDLWGWVSNLVAPVEGAEGAFRSFGGSVGAMVGGAVVQVGSFLGRIGEIPGTIQGAIGSVIEWLGGLTLFESGARLLSTAVEGARSKMGELLGAVQGAVNAVIEWLGSLNLAESGARLLSTFADGIRSKVGEVVGSVQGTLSQVRQYLPFSDAKVGPLSSLTASGAAVLATMAQGVQQAGAAPLGSALGAALAGAVGMAADAQAARAAPAAAAIAEGGAVGAGAVTISAPISIQIAGNGDPDAIQAAVEQALERAMARAEAGQRARLSD